MKENTDGASLGNPGLSGISISFQNGIGEFILVIALGLGVEEIFWAECLAIVVATEIAMEKGWRWLWIETDSKSAMESFTSYRIPWRLKERWVSCSRILQRLNYLIFGGKVIL